MNFERLERERCFPYGSLHMIKPKSITSLPSVGLLLSLMSSLSVTVPV
jgi:hypothetical protein